MWLLQRLHFSGINEITYITNITNITTIIIDNTNMSHLLLLGKSEYTGGPIFKVVLEC